MTIPFFDMRGELAAVRADVDAAIARVLDSGVFVGGPEVAAFERAVAPLGSAAHAVGVSSGTDALLAILMALGVGPDRTVVTTPFTFFATAGAAARLGARLVFEDVDDETLTLRGSGAGDVVIPVHLYGHPAAVPSGVTVVEDAAQSLGGPPLRGLAAAVSCFPTKNLGALGDAGIVLTNDAALAERVRRLRSHGAEPKYHHALVGGNFRLDAVQAAVLHAKLPHLAAWTSARRTNAARYREAFAAANLPDVRLPAHHAEHVYHQFVIRTPRRDALRAYLAERGIGTEVYYPEPLHLQPCFADLGYRAGSLPVAERACAEVLALPIYPTLPADVPGRVVEAVADFF